MTDRLLISFVKRADPAASPMTGTVIVLTDATLAMPSGGTSPDIAALVGRAAAIKDFKGKFASVLEILAPAGLGFDRLLAVGLGKPAELKAADIARLGGAIAGALKPGERATLLAERADGVAFTPAELAEIAEGMVLRAYAFDRYKSRKDDDAGQAPAAVAIAVDAPEAAIAAWDERQAVAEGALLARDLVNEPANVLGPEEFAAKAEALGALGVTIETLTEREMAALGMRALLGVAQGAARPPRLVVMRWNGGGESDGLKGDAKPVAFVGKGVVFDSGGISIKSAGGMEDMKGDMAGAAAVVGLMHALARRKAKANVIGVIGIVENMPDGNAQRPGDIVAAASGVTIEIINTDAEGRLVLADALWYVQKTYEPRVIVDLATLTGAIIVALGHDHAGMFSNDDTLAAALSAAGEATGEKVWRMPLEAAYDKQIESKFADIKNTGGRDGGSITAAQFIKRFVNDGVAWAHLDIAGTAIGSPQTEVNRSWASGFGVKLLDRLVKENYEQ